MCRARAGRHMENRASSKPVAAQGGLRAGIKILALLTSLGYCTLVSLGARQSRAPRWR